MKSILSVLVLLVVPLVASAASGTAIPGGSHSTPFIINKPGAYYLAGNRVMLNASATAAIEVLAPNVTLDLNGFTVGYETDVDGTEDAGIIIRSQEDNFELKNGSLCLAPGFAVRVSSGETVRIRDARVLGTQGINVSGVGTVVDRCHVAEARGCGIEVNSSGGTVERCTVTRTSRRKNDGAGIILMGESAALNCTVSATTKGGILVRGRGTVQNCRIDAISLDWPEGSSAISVQASGAIIQRNVIKNVRGVGINVIFSAYGTLVEDNYIHAVAKANGTGGDAIVSQNQTTIVRGNTGNFTDDAFLSGTYTNAGNNIGD